MDNRRTTWQRLLAALLSVFLVTGGVPVAALAEVDAQQPVQKAEQTAADPADSAVTPQADTEGSAAQAQPEAKDASDDAQNELESQEDKKVLSVSVRVIGPDKDNKNSDWLAAATVAVEEGKSAWDASKSAFDAAKLTYVAQQSQYGEYLDTISSPTESDRTLGYDGQTGKYWQLFVNGNASEVGASDLKPSEGDAIVWFYSSFGEKLEDAFEGEQKNDDEAGVKVDPNAERPNYQAFWPGFRGADKYNVTDVALPTTPGELAWEVDLKGVSMFVNMSDPIVVNGNVYMAVGDELRIIDGASGEVKKTAKLVTTIDYSSRVVYDGGLVMVPLAGGQVQALTADELVTVWVSDPVPEGAETTQSLGTGVVHNGIAYFQTCQGNESTVAYITAIKVADGSIAWRRQNDSAGYYWASPVFINDIMVIADESGVVTAYSATTGDVLSTESVGGKVRSGVALGGDGSSVYVVTRDDGTLHALTVDSDGKLTKKGDVAFGSYSTSTPTVCNGKIYVGGREGESSGLLAVIDEQGLTVEKKITTATDTSGSTAAIPGASGGVQSSVLVSTANNATHAYFTSNAEPGALYVYTQGADAAEVLYTPEEGLQQYCLYTPVPTEDGGVVYANDSGHLFKVVQGKTPTPTPTPTPADTPAPEMKSDVGGSFMSRSTIVKFTVTQKIPDDATSLMLWVDLDPVLEDASSDGQSNIEGGSIQTDGQRVYATLGDADTGISAQAEGDAVERMRGHTVEMVFNAKVKDDADLTPYLNEEGTTALIPYKANVRFNNDDSRRASSETKHLKVSVGNSGGSNSGGSSTASTGSRTVNGGTVTTTTSTPSTSDQTMGVAGIVIAAVVILGVGFVLHRRKQNQK